MEIKMSKSILYIFLFIMCLQLTSAILWDNLAYYNLDQGSGTTATDITGNGNTGTLFNDIAWTTNSKLGPYAISSNGNGNISVADNPAFTNGNLSISLWINITNATCAGSTDCGIITKWDNVGANGKSWMLTIRDSNIKILNSSGGSAAVTWDTGYPVKNRTWTNLVMRYNGTALALFVNGSYWNSTPMTGSPFFDSSEPLRIGAMGGNGFTYNGVIDEVGIWNRALSNTEISEIWNNGAGSPYGGSSAISVTLNFPSNGSTSSAIGATFNSSASVSGMNLTNATLYFYNSTSLVLSKSTVGFNGTTNSTSWTENLSPGTFFWNVLWCARNSTASNCSFASNNYTVFLTVPINAVNFSNSTFETSRERFTLNYTYTNILFSSATLYYNGTGYTSNVSCNTSNCLAINEFDIPTITLAGNQQNNSFYWSINIFNGTSSFTTNTDTYSQSVNRATLSYCSSGTIALNFTSYDEQNRTRISPFSFDATFNYYLGSGQVYKTVNITNSSTAEVNVCIDQNTTFYTNAIIAYTTNNASVNYITRNWFYQGHRINNTMQRVKLYLLTSGASTSFIHQVQDRYVLPVSGVLVNAQRCYPGIDQNETVFISRTDSSGLTVGNLEAETALYQFFITNYSNTLLSVIPCSKVVPRTTPYTLLFQLGSTYESPFLNIDNETDITESLVFNYTSNILTLTYIDTSGRFSYANLVVRSMNFTGNSQPIICNQNNTFSSGVITCNVSTPGSYTAQAYVYRSDNLLIDQITFTVQTISSTIGYYGAFLGFFLILIAAFAFKYNEIAGIWLINVVVIFCNIVGLIAFGKVFITSMLAISVIITAVLER